MNSYILQRCKLIFENKVEFTVSGEIITKYELRKRDSITNEEYKEIIRVAMKSYSIYLLAKRDYFKKDLENKLIMKYRNKEITLEVLEELEERGYLDDDNLAKSYVISHQKYGRRKLEYELKLKGIRAEIIRELLDENNEEEFLQLEKAIKKMLDKPFEKIVASLMRKGFSYQKIKEVYDRSVKLC